jgi:hypothetical protein
VARQVVVTGDLDGSPDAQTITYSVEGKEYEIDLAEKNAQKLRDTLSPFVKKSRPLERQAVIPSSARSGTRRKSSAGGGSSGRSDIGDIRPWAQAQGMKVAGRGRIKKEIIDAYDEAHK